MTVAEVYAEAEKLTNEQRATQWSICLFGRDKHSTDSLAQTYPLGNYYCEKCWTLFNSSKKPLNQPEIPLAWH